MTESETSTATETRLRAEIDELKRRLDSQERHPSRSTLWLLAFLALAGVVGAFLYGYIPHLRRQTMLVAEAKADSDAIPTVNVVSVERSPGSSELVLPGNIQAVTEAPLLARASGYVKKRYADIGDRVSAGQLLAEIEAPELGQQVMQATANLEQMRSSLEQATADLQQGQTNARMAKVTADRWSNLATRGVVSKQENDLYQSQLEAQQSKVQSLEKAVNVARSSVRVAEANLARLQQMQGYLRVQAPFAGVITVRNVDVGALVTEGNTLLYRIAQTDRLRTFVNLPQAAAASIRPGQTAILTTPDLPNRQFTGTVTRSANSLDPATRTMLTEVQIPNPNGLLMPGMYASVDLTTARQDPPLLIPGDTLIVRADGPQVAMIAPDRTVHFQRITIGRDYGDKIEVLSGLQAGQQIVVNPSDSVREKVKVNAVLLKEKPVRPAGGH
jgi:RND family efflux transporter MFP subunit